MHRVTNSVISMGEKYQRSFEKVCRAAPVNGHTSSNNGYCMCYVDGSVRCEGRHRIQGLLTGFVVDALRSLMCQLLGQGEEEG